MSARRLLCALVCVAGCHVSAEVETVAWTFTPKTIPGSPHPGAASQYERQESLHLSASVAKEVTSLTLKRLLFSPAAGVTRLDFVHSLTVTALGNATVHDQLLAHFEGEPPLQPDGSITLEALPNDLVVNAQLDLPFSVVADLAAPATDWTLGVTLEFRAISDGKLGL
jgi:hypothetical protein